MCNSDPIPKFKRAVTKDSKCGISPFSRLHCGIPFPISLCSVPIASENEPAKLLLPYLQRADELQKHQPLLAYYCRLYAMERGLKIPQKGRTKTTGALLVSLMNQLEKDKKSVDLGPDDHLHVEGFAINVFTKADNQDRAGRADLNTAKTFYAASIFFEILNHFCQLQPDLEQKQKYAAWKAADIRKALKEGRKPVPGPPGGDEDPSVPSKNEYDIEPRRSDASMKPDRTQTDSSATDADSSPQQHNKASLHHSRSSLQPSNTNLPTSPCNSTSLHNPTNGCPSNNFQSRPCFTDGSLPNLPSNYPMSGQFDSISRNGSVSEPSVTARQECKYDSNYEPSADQIAEAQKAARFAVSALAFDDVFVAVEHLKKALELLTNPSAGH